VRGAARKGGPYRKPVRKSVRAPPRALIVFGTSLTSALAMTDQGKKN
jgi:hypothetical protein